ncbi:hypothetical protein T02_8030, partial [Trichinella nativa]
LVNCFAHLYLQILKYDSSMYRPANGNLEYHKEAQKPEQQFKEESFFYI